MSRSTVLLPLLAIGLTAPVAGCEALGAFDRSMAKQCAVGEGSCADFSDPASITFDDEGRPTFHRDGTTEDGMEMLQVVRIDADEAPTDDGCVLERRGWAGVDGWVVEFDAAEIPLEVTYGFAPQGATQEFAAAPLQDGALYRALWGNCSCYDLWWTQGSSDIVRADECTN